jgi:dTDP-4-amino-4,6-dideoxygalactose transaminase
MGKAAAFSFYPGKNLGACGEAGAVTTNNVDIAQKVRMLRDHGQAKKYYHDIEGYNGRLDAIQSGVLHAKLPYLPKWNRQRCERAGRYRQLLMGQSGLKLPCDVPGFRPVYHLYVLCTDEREDLMAHLKSAGIATGIHYPIPLHLQEAYRSHGYSPGSFPVSEKTAAEVVSLPMFPHLTDEQQLRIATEILRFISEKPVLAQARSSIEVGRVERTAP